MITKRIFLIPFIWVFIIGGVITFLGQRSVGLNDEYEAPVVSRVIDIELLSTFDSGADPFSLFGASQGSLMVSLNGHPLVLEQAALMAGQPLRITVDQAVLAGGNEIFVSAVPSGSAQAAALRVRVSGGQLAKEKTLWTENGGRVAGEVNFEVHQ